MAVDLSRYPGGTVSEGYDTASPGEGKLPRIRGRKHDFYLIHSPRSWEIAEGPAGSELLPVLKPFSLTPGCNGVIQPEGKGRPNGAVARAGLEDRGVIVFRDSATFRRTHQGAYGLVYLWKWEHLISYPDGDFEIAWDQAGYDDFRRTLVAEGKVPPPRASTLRRLEKRLRKRVTINSRAALTDPAAKSRMEAAEGRLEALQVAKGGKAKPASKSGGKGSKSPQGE